MRSAGDWRPAPADELAALLLFYARDGFVDLRLASDLSAWWDVYGAELPAGALEELLGAYPALARVHSGRGEVAEKVVGLPAARIIGDVRKLGVRRAHGCAAGESQPALQPVAALCRHGTDRRAAGARGRVWRVREAPAAARPARCLDQQADTEPKRRARSRLARCVGMLARYALTMTRLLRAPEKRVVNGVTLKLREQLRTARAGERR